MLDFDIFTLFFIVACHFLGGIKYRIRNYRFTVFFIETIELFISAFIAYVGIIKLIMIFNLLSLPPLNANNYYQVIIEISQNLEILTTNTLIGGMAIATVLTGYSLWQFVQLLFN
jgi:hypothetical protein